MTIAPEEQPGSDTTSVAPNATLVQPITDQDLETATPLLLSIKTTHPDKPDLVLDEAGGTGGHVVRRKLTAEAHRHFYRVVYATPGRFAFKSFFSQPSTITTEALRVIVVTKNDDGTVMTSDNTGSSVAHGDDGGAQGSSVAHGDFGPMELQVFGSVPTYYIMVALIDGNTLVDEPYTLAVLQLPAPKI
jgi:hypothetical protein